MLIEIGDKLIVTRHGTDHSYEECYTVDTINERDIYMTKSGDADVLVHSIGIRTLRLALEKEHSQYRIEKKRKQYKLDERLFEL